jgi:HD-GYP domain-containing protein (c-di-GMP phosphodiesterase class II)
MPTIFLDNLVEGHVTEADYYSPKGQLLIGLGETITAQHLSLLKKRNIFELHTPESNIPGAGKPHPAPLAPEPIILPPSAETGWNIQPGRSGFEQLLTNRTAANLDHALKLDRATDHPIGKAFQTLMRQDYLFHRPQQYKQDITILYNDAIERIKLILNQLAAGTVIDTGSLRSLVEQFITPFLNDRNILLTIASQKMDRDDPLYNHTLNVCLLAMNIAAATNYSEEQVIQIGMGALLHDLGMLMIPPAIRFKAGRLDDEEWYEIHKHPLFGLHIIDRTLRLPDAAKYITYQIHERENGKGYPKQRSGRLIHNYAKITMVADIFEAVSSPRPYRRAFAPYKGMEMLIKMGKQCLINEHYVMAMLKSVSLFPVGSLVELNDGRTGQVIAANTYHLARPLVSIITEPDHTLLNGTATYPVDLSLDTSLQIVRSLPFGAINCDILYGL